MCVCLQSEVISQASHEVHFAEEDAERLDEQPKNSSGHNEIDSPVLRISTAFSLQHCSLKCSVRVLLLQKLHL